MLNFDHRVTFVSWEADIDINSIVAKIVSESYVIGSNPERLLTMLITLCQYWLYNISNIFSMKTNKSPPPWEREGGMFYCFAHVGRYSMSVSNNLCNM